MQKQKNPIPVFYAADENYMPFLGVAHESLKKNASPDREYRVHVLTNGKLGENAQRIKDMQTQNVTLNFHDVSKKLNQIMHMLHCRDYYTPAIF